MAKLTAKKRKKLPAKDFAGPNRSYPVNDRSHAGNAKARAKQMLNKGKLGRGSYDNIIAKADKILKK